MSLTCQDMNIPSLMWHTGSGDIQTVRVTQCLHLTNFSGTLSLSIQYRLARLYNLLSNLERIQRDIGRFKIVQIKIPVILGDLLKLLWFKTVTSSGSEWLWTVAVIH